MKSTISRLSVKIIRPFYNFAAAFWDSYYYNKWLKKYDDRIVPGVSDQGALISIIVPVYNPPQKFFREMMDSVISQTCAKWELILVDDNSSDPYVKETIKEYCSNDPRIKSYFLKRNMGISGATNEGIIKANGEYIALLDHDDILYENSLAVVTSYIVKNKWPNFLYTDEDKIDGKGRRVQPLVKPELNIDFLRSVNYITHFAVIKRSIVQSLGLERSDYDGAQDWDLFLRISRAVDSKSIVHVPYVAYGWRVHATSTAFSLSAKPYVIEAQKKAIESDILARDGAVDFCVRQDCKYPGQWRVSFAIKNEPKVLIVSKNGSPRVVSPADYSHLSIVSYDLFKDNLLDNVDYVILEGRGGILSMEKEFIFGLLRDSQRKEIAYVLSLSNFKGHLNTTLTDLIGKRGVDLVRRLSRNSVSRHLYRTCRYNIRYAGEGTAVVKASILKEGLKHNQIDDLLGLTAHAYENGYTNLYVPYI